MTIQILSDFFMWCTIINGGIFLFWIVFVLLAPDFVYRVQSRWFPVSRQSFDLAIYSFMGLFKLFYIFFNVVPWIALLIISQ